jgi:hypothetical protein
MSNSHGTPDTLKEIQSIDGDLLAPCILSTTWPTVPASSLTLAAFATYGYARSGRDLVFIDQPAVTVTLPSAAGLYWLGLHRDTSSAVSGWTRRAGSHYIFGLSAGQPAPPDGAVLLSSVTVAGSIITAVSQTGILRAPMSRQDASAVAITGGTLVLPPVATVGAITITNVAGNDLVGIRSDLASGTNRYSLFLGGTAPNYLGGGLGIRAVPLPTVNMYLAIPAGIYGLVTIPTGGTDAVACEFRNQGGTAVGSIYTTAIGTAFNTSSDVRLKHAIATLIGGLDRVRALRPVAFRWNADDSAGVGFLAHELQQTMPEAVMGVPDAVTEDGSIKPQQVDHSKLVPWLVASIQELAAQVQTLTVRIATLEEALGA